MSEVNYYCDYPTNECMFAKETDDLRKKLQAILQENQELKARVQEMKCLNASQPPVDMW